MTGTADKVAFMTMTTTKRSTLSCWIYTTQQIGQVLESRYGHLKKSSSLPITSQVKNNMNQSVKKICPSASELSKEVCRNVVCPVPGCEKILSQPSALRFHKIKVHGLIENETDRRLFRHQKPPEENLQETCQFHCPALKCAYNINGMKHFSTFKLLKQHFMRIHGPQSYICPACQASFGVSYTLARHVKNCRFARFDGDRIIEQSRCDGNHMNRQCVEIDAINTHQELVKSGNINDSHDQQCVIKQIDFTNDGQKQWSRDKDYSDEVLGVIKQIDFTNDAQRPEKYKERTVDTSTVSVEKRTTQPSTNNSLTITIKNAESIEIEVSSPTGVCSPDDRLTKKSQSFVGGTAQVIISRRDDSTDCVTVRLDKNGVQRKRSSRKNSVVKPAHLLMKPNAILMPVNLPVVILPGAGQSSFTSGRLTKQQLITPKPPVENSFTELATSSRCGSSHSTLKLLSATSCMRPRPELVSSIGTQCSLTTDGPGFKVASRSRNADIRGTQCSQSTNVLRRKVAETQTIGLKDTTLRQLKKTSAMAAAQVSPRNSARSYRAICHSHTQTHGNHRKVQRHLVAAVDPRLDYSPNFFWPDVASNATQTVYLPGDCESTRTQTSESYLNEYASQTPSMLFNDGTWIPEPSSSFGAEIKNAEKSYLSVSVAAPSELCSSDLASDTYVTSKLDVHNPVPTADYRSDLMPLHCHDNELFQSTRDVSVQFDELLDELVMSASTRSVQVTESQDESLSCLTLTSASQTVAIDFDAVSTQTMECDFDAVDFDFANTETQTNDLFDTYFGFSDIETQTAHDMQLWDSQTQTCFDSLNI